MAEARRCGGCQDGYHCHQDAFVRVGMLLWPCACPDCAPQPIQLALPEGT